LYTYRDNSKVNFNLSLRNSQLLREHPGAFQQCSLYISHNKELSALFIYILPLRKYVLNIWSEHNYIFSHRIVHTTTGFGHRQVVL